MPFGTTLDVIPYVASDGYTIHLTVIPKITEFLGYEEAPFQNQVIAGVGNTVSHATPYYPHQLLPDSEMEPPRTRGTQ